MPGTKANGQNYDKFVAKTRARHKIIATNKIHCTWHMFSRKSALKKIATNRQNYKIIASTI